MLFLLHQTMAGARSRRKTGTHFSGSRSKPGILEATGGQKGSPAKGTGHTLLVAAQYSQKSPENNGLFAIWLADFGAERGRPPDIPQVIGFVTPALAGVVR
jgi:hypothetical protein